MCHGPGSKRCFGAGGRRSAAPGSVYCRGMDMGAEDPEKPPQGWFVDPFGVHEQRWYSQGRATSLVRDGRTETQDPPPDGVVTGPLMRSHPYPGPGRASDDLLRGDDRGETPGEVPEGQFDFFGNPALPGTVGMSPAVPMGGQSGGLVINPMDFLTRRPPTPKRSLRHRWIALGGAVVWSFLITGLFLGATTTNAGVPGHVRTETVYAASPGAVIFLIAVVAVACVVSGLSLVRRIRQKSEEWSRWGSVCVGVVALLGFLSLASVGLSLVVLAAMLFVVARPLRKLRPIPGDRLVGP